MKKKLAILLLASLAMTACSKKTEEIYPRTMVVSELETETDTVVLRDAVGHTWEFYGIEDWQIGDICSCIMDTNGTEEITDDMIVKTVYNGRMEDLK
jgi:hypothetical protein